MKRSKFLKPFNLFAGCVAVLLVFANVNFFLGVILDSSILRRVGVVSFLICATVAFLPLFSFLVVESVKRLRNWWRRET